MDLSFSSHQIISHWRH